jgi:type IV secretory pathway VirB2 component (pilin)
MSNFKLDVSICWGFCITFCLASAITLLPSISEAAAQQGGAIADVLCRVRDALTGPIGRGIATIAVVALGIGLFLGKLSWGLAVATALGIGMIFGANTIVMWLSPDAGADCVVGGGGP